MFYLIIIVQPVGNNGEVYNMKDWHFLDISCRFHQSLVYVKKKGMKIIENRAVLKKPKVKRKKNTVKKALNDTFKARKRLTSLSEMHAF